MPKRFIVTDYDEAKLYEDPDDWLAFGHPDEFCSYLVDTDEGVVVFCDAMEPEDATLTRDLHTLIAYMEKLAA